MCRTLELFSNDPSAEPKPFLTSDSENQHLLETKILDLIKEVKLQNKYNFIATSKALDIDDECVQLVEVNDSKSSLGQVTKIEPVQAREYEEPIAFREVALGCTALTVYMEYAVFVSDNRGRIHVWTPYYTERAQDEKPNRRTRAPVCVYQVRGVFLNFL